MKSGKKEPVALGSNVVHPNVSRVDYEHNHGYSVRIQRKHKETSKLFSDAVYGGKLKAKRAAIQWREKMLKELGAVIWGRSRPQNPPGYSYIQRKPVTVTTTKGSHETMCWVGFLRIEGGKHLSTRWSVPKWGSRKAKANCEAWLARKKAELEARLGRKLPTLLTTPAKPQKPRPSKPATTPTQLGFEMCGGCGGVVRLKDGPGRIYWYRGRREVEIPGDFPTETCAGCGEIYMTDKEAEALEGRIEKTLAKKRRNRAGKRKAA